MSRDLPESEPKPKEAPHTHKDAKVLSKKSVTNARAVYIDKVRYRQAEFGGRFLLADDPVRYHLDTVQLRVKMTWFGWAPEDGACRITPLTPVTLSVGTYDDIIENVGLENWQFKS